MCGTRHHAVVAGGPPGVRLISELQVAHGGGELIKLFRIGSAEAGLEVVIQPTCGQNLRDYDIDVETVRVECGEDNPEHGHHRPLVVLEGRGLAVYNLHQGNVVVEEDQHLHHASARSVVGDEASIAPSLHPIHLGVAIASENLGHMFE